jgi:transposase
MRRKKQETESLERALAKRYWSADDARLVLAASTASGLSDGEFAQRNGVSGQRVGWWRRRFAAGEMPSTPERPAFMPVRVVPARSSAPVPDAPTAPNVSSRMEVVLLSGRRLVLGADFDARAVAQLVGLLEEAGPC